MNSYARLVCIRSIKTTVIGLRGNPATAHCCVILKRYNVILPQIYCFFIWVCCFNQPNTTSNNFYRHEIICTGNTVHFSVSLSPACCTGDNRTCCTGDNRNKVKVANQVPVSAGAPFLFTSSRLVNTSCDVMRTLFPSRKSYTRYIRHHQNAPLFDK